jgi:hypothetical protein
VAALGQRGEGNAARAFVQEYPVDIDECRVIVEYTY